MSLTGMVFFVSFMAALVLALVRHPIYGLYAYLAAFYLDPPSRWWSAGLPTLRWALLAAVVALVATFRVPKVAGRKSWLATTPAKLLVALVLWIWIQNLWALEPSEHFELSVLFTKYAVLYYLIYKLIDSPDRVTWFLLANLAGCLYLGWLAHGARFAGRLEGVGGPGIDEANAFGMHMATAVILGSMMILSLRGWRRWFVILAMPFCLNALVLTGSRSSFLGLMAGGLMLWFLRPQIRRRAFYGFALLALIMFGMLAHEQFWERISTIGAVAESREAMDTSAESRLVLVEAQFRMAQRYPQGTGHRGTATLSPMYLDEKYLTPSYHNPNQLARSSHNTFMTALVEQGVPGAIIFLGLVVWLVKTIAVLKRSIELPDLLPARNSAVALAAALVVVLVSGIFVDYLKAEVQIWCFALLAAITGMLHTQHADSTGAGISLKQPPRGIRQRQQVRRLLPQK